MGGPKKLLHGRVTKRERPERFQVKRKLFFGNFFNTVAILSLVSSQASASILSNRQEPQLKMPGAAKPTMKDYNCIQEAKEVTLEPDETITETVCKRNHIFVLTNTSLIIITPNPEKTEDKPSGVSHINTYTRTDIRDVLDAGLVAWTQSEEACYFLTKDRVLGILPIAPTEETMTAHRLHYNVNKAKMVFSSELLFIAPASGRMYIISFSKGFDSRIVPLHLKTKNPGFFVSDGKLFFGENKGEKIEIQINGQGLDTVRLIRR